MADKKESYDSIRFAKDAGDLASHRKKLYQGLGRDHIEWKMNREFYKGNQWVFPNPNMNGQIQDLNFGLGDHAQSRYKVRLTSNQIKQGVMSYVAQLTKTKPVINASPNSGDDKDLKSAQMAEALYEYWWREFNMKSKLQSALVNATLSQGYWKISWDPYAGKGTTFMVGPDGQPITDPHLSDLYKEEIEAAGGDPAQFSKTVNLGDITIEVIPGENVILDPAAATFEDAEFAICKHSMDPSEIQARWGVTVKADQTVDDSQSGLPWGLQAKQGQDKPNPVTKDVWIMYHRKSPALPQGRYVAWIEGPDKVLMDTPWEFPFDELPLVKFPGIERPNSPLDDPLVTDARPIQKELNRTLSQIVQHKNLTIKPQMLAPTGSLRDRLNDEPGAVFQFNPVGNQRPEWREMPSLPPYVFEHLQDIQGRLDRLFNLASVSRGDVPPNVEAGIAIDLLQEAAVDQVSPIIQRLEEALVRAGHIMASFAQTYYIEPRLLKIIGAGGTVQVKKFKNSDISGGFSFYAEAGSGLPRTRAGKQAQIEFMLQNQLIDPRSALKRLDVADSKGLLQKLAQDEDMANRENEKLMKGEPTNPLALHTMMAQVQQVMADPTADPDGDGQPDTPEQKMAWAQQQLEQAAVAPQPFEDYQTHLDVHGSFMKSAEFEHLDPQIQQGFIDHFTTTLQTMINIPQVPEPKAVQTTLQLKGTLGPTAAAEILNKNGVLDVTPEQLTEQPLETWVTDSLDKPDVEEAGNDPLTQAEQIQGMQQKQAEADLTAMKTAHQAALAHRAANQDAESKDQKARHAEELHQQRLAHNEQKHRQAQRAAAASSKE